MVEWRDLSDVSILFRPSQQEWGAAKMSVTTTNDNRRSVANIK